ncbi:MAG: ankyrin repeat domain-containing protein [Deltaproteobacteria bacterium]|nr:ankyrin repeat domain-containing protein [Deltaproteobacteria bacterium]
MKQRKMMTVGWWVILFLITACSLGDSTLSSEPTEEELFAQVKEKIEKGAPVDKKDDRGLTTLMWAAEKNSLKIATLLMEHGADVNAKNNSGQTPLIYAAMNNALDVARLLIAKGADINVQDDFTLTALLWAEVKRYDDMITLLRKHGGK